MTRSTLLAALATVSLTGCDYTGDWLFPQATEVAGIMDLGSLEPDVVTTLDEARAAIRYGEIGATGTAQVGGMSFEFTGTGGSVCVWVDPETVYWNQSVATQAPRAWWSYPDNHDDDGDIDLYAGVSVYYSGSPGSEIGNFEVRYADALGNEIPVEFNECVITSEELEVGSHAGRGMAEFCALKNTQLGVDYTVVLETFSAPNDDNRLGYGLLFVEGDCSELKDIVQDNDLDSEECLIVGESIMPGHGHDYEADPFLARGYAEVEPLAWPLSTDVETAFCGAERAKLGLYEFCEGEEIRVPFRRDCDDPEIRCFCGDLRETPTGGAR
jgi:hypothetical protein